MKQWQPEIVGLSFESLTEEEFEILLEELVEIIYSQICQQNRATDSLKSKGEK